MGIIRINNVEDLKRVAKELGVRDDWHEPDERHIHAIVFGSVFDNAGRWGVRLIDHGKDTGGAEMFVVLYRGGMRFAEVNLATLFAMATGNKA